MIPNTDNITYFTTFNEDGYLLYGKSWIRSFVDVADVNKNIKARIYCEGFVPDIPHESIEYVDFGQAIPEHGRWKTEYTQRTEHMSYTKKMTIRFSHKAFVIQHALDNPSDRYMVWLDGDCVFKPADHTMFASTVTNNKVLACQVEAMKGTTISHVESGILVFDTKHPDLERLNSAFKILYRPAQVIKMPNDAEDTKADGNWQDYGPYDGFILHRALVVSEVAFENLNATDQLDRPVSAASSTFYHPELKTRFVHNIGPAGKREYTQHDGATR